MGGARQEHKAQSQKQDQEKDPGAGRWARIQAAESSGDGFGWVPGSLWQQGDGGWCVDKDVCREDKGPGHPRTLGRMNTIRTGREDMKAQSSPAAEGRAAIPFRAHEMCSHYGPGLVPGTREVQMLRRPCPGAQKELCSGQCKCYHRCKLQASELGKCSPNALGKNHLASG